MPQKKVTIEFGGEQVQAEPIDVQSSTECWNEYRLEDGTALRVKLILHDVLRLVGKYNPTGEPIYAIRTSNVLDARVPDFLKARGNN